MPLNRLASLNALARSTRPARVGRHASSCRPTCHLHQAPTQPVDPEEDQPEHPQEPPVPEPGLPVIRPQ